MNDNIIYRICLLLMVFTVLSSASFLQYKQGDHCDIKRINKTCQDVKKCPLEAEAVRKGLVPDVCGLRESELVCCSKSLKIFNFNKNHELIKEEEIVKRKTVIKRAAVGEKSKQMCKKYAEAVYSEEDDPILLPGAEKIKHDNCGIKETPLIVGGDKAKGMEFPHMVLIGHLMNDSDPKAEIFWQCGGSLISERWVLSAAHCTATFRGLAKRATLGDLKVLSNEDEDFSDPITIPIIERRNHPNYHSSKSYNDIALYKLERDVVFNAFIRPICLNTADTVYTGKAIASGWGNTKWRGSSSTDLMKVTLNLHDMNDCKNLFSKSTNIGLRNKIPQGITANNMVCAWEKGKDTCQGDSGGPLQVGLSDPYCMYSLIGITSFGDECATNLPGVYTRVSNYISWIEPIVWP